MHISKKLLTTGGSKAVVLPADWLKQYGDPDWVVLDVNGKITITPLVEDKKGA